MTNELQIFNPWTREEKVSSRTPISGPTQFHGYVYAIEYGDQIKIGMTRNVAQRMKTLKSHAEKYGSVPTGEFVWSEAHTNFAENEKILHNFFASKRRSGTELFNLTLDEFMNDMPKLSYEDKSNEYSEKSDFFLEGMKRFILGSACEKTNAGTENELLRFLLSILSYETRERIIKEMLAYGYTNGFPMHKILESLPR